MKDKLLRQIGFSEESYILEDPFGTSMGGSGLMATPEDLLRTGCMMLKQEKGSYVARATEPRTATQPDGADGWYGYMIPIPMEGTFGMMGMGGQMMPGISGNGSRRCNDSRYAGDGRSRAADAKCCDRSSTEGLFSGKRCGENNVACAAYSV